MRNPMTSPKAPVFQYGMAYGYLPSHNIAATSTHTYPSLLSPHAHSLLPLPGNGETGGVAAYLSPATYPHKWQHVTNFFNPKTPGIANTNDDYVLVLPPVTCSQ